MDKNKLMIENGGESRLKTNQKIFRGILILIVGIVLLSTLECIKLLKSVQCFVQDGQYHIINKHMKQGHFEKENQQRNNGLLSPQDFKFSPSVPINDDNDIQTIDDTQRQRQIQLRETCHKIKSRVNQTYGKLPNLFYSDKKAAIYCAVPKVACTNWKRVFLYFEDKVANPLEIGVKAEVHTQKYNILANRKANQRIQRLNMYYSFIFVRHPFERLLSAYRNKFLDPYNSVFQQRYGKTILRLFRSDAPIEEIKAGRNVTFSEFVKYVIYCSENHIKLDEHWEVMNKLCSPCSIKYNYIGKMTSLVEDAQQVLKELGVDNDVEFPANSKDKYKTNIKDLIKEYYSTVTDEHRNKLYDIYKEDFELFGYTIPEYLRN